MIKKIFLKKNSGNITYVATILATVFLIAFFTVYQLTERKTIHLKNNIDNGIILSLLSTNLLDDYQFATHSDIVYSCDENIDFRLESDNANKKAANIAYQRFMKSLIVNVKVAGFSDSIKTDYNNNLSISEDNTVVKNVKLDKFIVYNVVDSEIYKTEKQNNDFVVTKLSSSRDTENIDKEIKNSCIYVKMNFDLYTYGNYTVNIPFEEIVDMTYE